jgi:hypothetical protein
MLGQTGLAVAFKLIESGARSRFPEFSVVADRRNWLTDEEDRSLREWKAFLPHCFSKDF